MRLTIIRDDDVVLVDGRALHVDLPLLLPANLHAVQWDGLAGHVEYNDGTPNERLENIAAWQSVVDAWEAVREVADAPKPSPDPATIRRIDIQRELDAIDLQSVRPLRAKLAGTATAEDEARLASLEEQAQTLRAELAGLPQ